MAIKKKDEILEIQEIKTGEVKFHVLGTSPMIMNRFSQKAWQQLLLPSERKSRATLDQTLKHDPVAEFRGALYLNRDPKSPTLVHVPNGAFHGALASAALDIPGAAKAKMERLTQLTDITVNLFGVPHLFCAMVRNSDMNRTPDVRTRPIFPQWCCTVTVSYVSSVLTQQTIGNLFSAAGVIVGIGDWRRQKGGAFGSFEIVTADDSDFAQIVKNQGRKAQQAAYDNPVCFDHDSEELMAWYHAELHRREKTAPSSGEKAAAKLPKTRRGVVVENGHGEVLAG